MWGSVDGNPLLYALKNKNGWKWKHPKQDIQKFFKRFIDVSNKIQTHYDVCIIVPSINELNIMIINIIRDIVTPEIVIEDIFLKITKEDAANSINFDSLKKNAGRTQTMFFMTP